MKLTKRVVEAATPKGESYLIWDSECRGFGVVVWPSGERSYIFNYRSPEGRTRRITLGKHGVITCEQARKLAADHKNAVAHGGDPLGQKRALRESLTVGDILDEYLASENFANKTPITQAIDRGRIERHLRPLLGKRHAHTLTEADVRKAYAAIRDGKTKADVKTVARGRARVRGGEGAAKMAIIILGVIFNWAIRARKLKENPCRFVKVGSFGTRDTILDGAADYATLFKTLEQMERERRIRQQAADAIRLIALTGCRRGEVANLRWEHVEKGRIVLPPNAHKTGKRTGKPKIVALTTVAQAIIARQPEGGDLVFAPAKGDGGAIELSHVWSKVRKEAGLPAKLTLHGLRHSVASHMAMAGAQASEIMQALGHRQLATAQKYIHWHEDARQVVAEKAAKVALAGMAEASKGPKAKVFRMKGGKR